MKLGISLILLSTSASFMAQKPSNIPDSLQEAMEKSKKLVFSGKRLVTTVKAGKKEEHFELVSKDGKKVRIEFAPDSEFSGQIIIEDGSQRFHFFPDKNEVRISPTFGRKQFEMIKLAARNNPGKNLVKMGDGGTIAGLRCQKVTVNDQGGNTIANLFFDAKTGMFLKRVIFDPSGSIIGSYEFLNVEFKPKFDSNAFRFNRKGVKIVRPLDELRRVSEQMSLPTVGLQPKGKFQLESANKRSFRGNDTLVQNYFGDDVRITLFVTKSDINKEGMKNPRRAFNSYRWSVNGVNCMLVGSLSESELKNLSTQVVDLGK